MLSQVFASYYFEEMIIMGGKQVNGNSKSL